MHPGALSTQQGSGRALSFGLCWVGLPLTPEDTVKQEGKPLDLVVKGMLPGVRTRDVLWMCSVPLNTHGLGVCAEGKVRAGPDACGSMVCGFSVVSALHVA